MFNFFKRRKAQKACDAFNLANPVGTRVVLFGRSYRPYAASGDLLTSDIAKVFANVAVVRLVGNLDLYPLDSLIVRPPRIAYPTGTGYHRQAAEPAPQTSPTSSFTDDFSSPSYTPASSRSHDPAPAIVSGGGGSFGGGGASSSWGDSSSSSSDSSSSSSSDSGSSSSSSSD